MENNVNTTTEVIEKKGRNAVTADASPLLSVMFSTIAELGLTPYTWDKMPNLLAVRAGKKTAAEIYVGKKDYRINVRQTVFDAVEIDGYTTIKNYYLPACLKKIPLADTETVVKTLNSIRNLYAEYLPTEPKQEEKPVEAPKQEEKPAEEKKEKTKPANKKGGSKKKTK